MATKKENDNLTLFKEVMTTPEEARKTIQAGKLQGMTDINPMWRIKRLTEIFGAQGDGWKLNIESMNVYQSPTEAMASVVASLQYRLSNGEWSEKVMGVGGSKLYGKGVDKDTNVINDEAFKMAYTDAISICCKGLGMSADIYFAKDRTKYDVATAPSAPTPRDYTPISENKYWQVIAAAAEGRKAQSGVTQKEAWKAATNPTPEAVAKFDDDVLNYKISNNLK